MREERLARAFVEFSDTLVQGYDVIDFLDRLCARCVEVLEVSAAGALVDVGAGRLELVAASTEAALVLETFQVRRRKGPSVDAYRRGEQVTVADLRASARRWPAFTARALSIGVVAVSAFPMRLRQERLGALNVFHTVPGAMSQSALAAGQALADVATIAILQARVVEDATRLAGQLTHALDSRVVIEQAKGVLAERLGVPPDEAFRRLRRYGRVRGLPLTDLARQVVAGTLGHDP
jgi:GAF domain-containing protein